VQYEQSIEYIETTVSNTEIIRFDTQQW